MGRTTTNEYTLDQLRNWSRLLTETSGTIESNILMLRGLGIEKVEVAGTLERSKKELPAFARNLSDVVLAAQIDAGEFGTPAQVPPPTRGTARNGKTKSPTKRAKRSK